MLLPQLVGGLLQERPTVPEFKPINVQAQQRTAIAGNAAVVPQLIDLAGKVNQYESDELLKRLNTLFPGYSALLDKYRKGVETQLSGELPSDVTRAVTQASAERSAASGTSGSEFARNLNLRDLGLTSLDQINKGMDSATRWLAMAQQNRGPMFDFTSMFVTPQQQVQVALGERNAQFQRDFVENQLKAEYSLGTVAGRALIKTDDQIMQIASSLAGTAAKGLMA